MKHRQRMQRWSAEANTVVDGAFGGAALLVLHEWNALRGHWAEVQERLAVARRARHAGELIRDQFDLVAESRNRLRRDHQVRRQIWRGLLRDLRRRPAETAGA